MNIKVKERTKTEKLYGLIHHIIKVYTQILAGTF